MFKNDKTPDLKMNLNMNVGSPFSRKKTSSPSLDARTADMPSHANDNDSTGKKSLIKNPLKSIKRMSDKLQGEDGKDLDTRDYHAASPNVELENAASPQAGASFFTNSIKKPNISFQKFRSNDNLSVGLETLTYGVYELQKYGIVGNVKALAFDPNQSLMAVVTHFNQIYILGQSRVNVSVKLDTATSIKALKFIKGIYLIAIDSLNTIHVVSLLKKRVLHKCTAKLPITSFTADYSIEFVFIGLQNGSVKAFNIETGKDTVLNLRQQHDPSFLFDQQGQVTSLNIHPRDLGTLLISYPKLTIIYNLASNNILHYLCYGIPKTAPGGENSVFDYTPGDEGKYYPAVLHNIWHPNGLHCITVHDDNSIVFWDAKTGHKILARTLFDVDVDRPTGRHQKISKNRLTKIKNIKWLCEENPEKTSLLILGGDGYSSDGYHQLVRMNFGKMISYSMSTYKHMAQYYSQPKEQRIFAIHSKNSSIVDFVPLGESSPYFDGGHHPKLISVIMDDGTIKFLHYPEGMLSTKAKYFPSSISWLNPKLICSSSSYMDKKVLNNISVLKKINEFPDSILKGGIPCRPKFKADSGSLIITGHENGFVRLWNSSEGDLDSDHVFEIDISSILQRDDDDVSVMKVSFASETLQVVCSLKNGYVLIFNYAINRRFGQDDLISKMTNLSLDNSGRALYNIQEYSPNDIKRGFMPKLLVKPLDNGNITSIKSSNLGLVAIGYASGRLLLIDDKNGAVIYNEIIKDKGLSLPIEATSIEFAYGIHSQSNERGVVLMYVGTNIGRLLTYEILGLPGSLRVNFIEQIDSNDELINSIIVVNSETGRPLSPTIEHFRRDFTQDRVYPIILTSSSSDIRAIKNNSKLSHKTYNKGDVSKVGITGSRVPNTNLVSFALVVILANTKSILCLTIPSLGEISKIRIPYKVSADFAKESSVLPLGDVFLRIDETEAALINIMNLRVPVRSVEINRSSDALFLKNIAVPWRPGSNPMLKNTPNLTYPQLCTLLTGHTNKVNNENEESYYAWETSCYNPTNYTYINASKPIYYNPNAVHQNVKLMEIPSSNDIFQQKRNKYGKEQGWFDNVSKYANETLEHAQSNVDNYIEGLNDDFDKMVSDAKHDAVKGLLSGKFF